MAIKEVALGITYFLLIIVLFYIFRVFFKFLSEQRIKKKDKGIEEWKKRDQK